MTPDPCTSDRYTSGRAGGGRSNDIADFSLCGCSYTMVHVKEGSVYLQRKPLVSDNTFKKAAQLLKLNDTI